MNEQQTKRAELEEAHYTKYANSFVAYRSSRTDNEAEHILDFVAELDRLDNPKPQPGRNANLLTL